MVSKPQFGAIFPIFRGPFLKRVAQGHHVSTLLELKDNFSDSSPPKHQQPLKDWFDFFYSILLNQYRCEYVYKNIITTKLYLDEHHDPQESLLTGELRSGNSRADVVILNGTSTVYEIKSAYDSFERLDSQIEDYRKVFDRIVVVTTEEKSELAIDRVDDPIGVMKLNAEGCLTVVREASSNKANTDPATVFDCMRQSEFCAVIKTAFGDIPNVPKSRIYREARAQFCRLDPSVAHDLMVKRVRMRDNRKPFSDLVASSPVSLKHACVLFSNKTQALAIQLKERLEDPLCETTSHSFGASSMN